jgi:hypothetical protein
MAKRTTKTSQSRALVTTEQPKERIALGELLSEKPPVIDFLFWIIGDTPLIVHAWSEKAKLEMLKKQSGATRVAKEKRDPKEDFLNALYEMTPKVYGFPITAVKKAILACAHKDRGIPRSDVMSALWLDAEMIRTRPALAGAICDMPLVRIYGSPPEMREDMVRIGAGVRKTANLAYRGQFTTWAIRVTGSVNPDVVAPHALAFLTRQAGFSVGIGDWRNEKGGWFGSFHIADPQEQREWELFAAGKGPLPLVKPKLATQPKPKAAA